MSAARSPSVDSGLGSCQNGEDPLTEMPTDSEVDRIKACESVFRMAHKSLLRLDEELRQGLSETGVLATNELGAADRFMVLRQADVVISPARRAVVKGHHALVTYRKRMEQAQSQRPGTVVLYPTYLQEALTLVAEIDLEALRANLDTSSPNASTIGPIIQAVERAKDFQKHGDI